MNAARSTKNGSTLQKLQAPVTEMWALWRRSVGDVIFLKELFHLKRFHVINRTTDQIGGLADLKQLQTLSIETDQKLDVDVRSWPLLEDLLFFWSGKVTGLADAREAYVKLSILRWREPDLQRLREAPQYANSPSLRAVFGPCLALRHVETLSHCPCLT